jgi:hypothetical protein
MSVALITQRLAYQGLTRSDPLWYKAAIISALHVRACYDQELGRYARCRPYVRVRVCNRSLRRGCNCRGCKRQDQFC